MGRIEQISIENWDKLDFDSISIMQLLQLTVRRPNSTAPEWLEFID